MVAATSHFWFQLPCPYLFLLLGQTVFTNWTLETPTWCFFHPFLFFPFLLPLLTIIKHAYSYLAIFFKMFILTGWRQMAIKTKRICLPNHCHQTPSFCQQMSMLLFLLSWKPIVWRKSVLRPQSDRLQLFFLLKAGALMWFWVQINHFLSVK